MVGARILETPVNEPGTSLSTGGFTGHAALHFGPAGESVLASERMLHIPQSRLGWCVGKGAIETSASFRVVCAKLLEPALRFPLQILEGASGRELPGHTFLP